MRLCYIPMYCGGRLLIGLYDNPKQNIPISNYPYAKSVDVPDEEVVENNLKRNHYSKSPMDYGQNADLYHFIPKDLTLFQRLMKTYLLSTSGHVGTLIAITNGKQEIAAYHLSKTGFKAAIKSDKMYGAHLSYSKQRAEDHLEEYGCTTWIGDYHFDVKPILDKVEVFKV